MSDFLRSSDGRGVEIRLEEVTKAYPGSDVPAVDAVSMTIPAGEIVVLVGPSGCGKTTTMKMINRIIEPTSGRIMVDGQNVLELDGDQLRRRIGYVIQQIGLLPHLTIAENVALVPKMLKWDNARTAKRVDELLDVTGLDPRLYGDRYPKQLSGGQQQRVGVARALAADPPVMLMDEPFGATDPITRDKLQNEFLRLQQELGKTIVFVTHDFDEAVKMGDRIAVLREQSHIAQFDRPAVILSHPSSGYVADFIGSGPSLKSLDLAAVKSLQLRQPLTGGGRRVRVHGGRPHGSRRPRVGPGAGQGAAAAGVAARRGAALRRPGGSRGVPRTRHQRRRDAAGRPGRHPSLPHRRRRRRGRRGPPAGHRLHDPAHGRRARRAVRRGRRPGGRGRRRRRRRPADLLAPGRPVSTETQTPARVDDDGAAASGGAGEQRSPSPSRSAGLGKSRPARLAALFATPLILAAVCLVLYLYVSSLDLDSIEQRQLNSTSIRNQLWGHVSCPSSRPRSSS